MIYDKEKLKKLVDEAGSVYRLAKVTGVRFQTLYVWHTSDTKPNECGKQFKKIKPFFTGTKTVEEAMKDAYS